MTYRLSDNNFASTNETFETNSYYEAMNEIEKRVVKGSEIVCIFLDKSTNLEKRYRWDSETNSIYNY